MNDRQLISIATILVGLIVVMKRGLGETLNPSPTPTSEPVPGPIPEGPQLIAPQEGWFQRANSGQIDLARKAFQIAYLQGLGPTLSMLAVVIGAMESSWDRSEASKGPSGERGYFQFMPATGTDVMRKANPSNRTLLSSSYNDPKVAFLWTDMEAQITMFRTYVREIERISGQPFTISTVAFWNVGPAGNLGSANAIAYRQKAEAYARSWNELRRTKNI